MLEEGLLPPERMARMKELEEVSRESSEKRARLLADHQAEFEKSQKVDEELMVIFQELVQARAYHRLITSNLGSALLGEGLEVKTPKGWTWTFRAIPEEKRFRVAWNNGSETARATNVSGMLMAALKRGLPMRPVSKEAA